MVQYIEIYKKHGTFIMCQAINSCYLPCKMFSFVQ